MREITCVLLQREERDALKRCRPFIGLGAPSDDERADRERRWNGLLQQHEVLHYEAVERGQIIALKALAAAHEEADPDYWSSAAKRTAQGRRMVEVLTESRAQMGLDLAVALAVLDVAVSLATPRLYGNDLEGED